MNIAVINIKDVFKFALKVGLAVVLIYFSMNILKGERNVFPPFSGCLHNILKGENTYYFI